jgi:phosphomethylpyrimidine synthase
MKITQEVREYAASGMAEMSDTFRETGGEIYQDAEALKAKASGKKTALPAAE